MNRRKLLISAGITIIVILLVLTVFLGYISSKRTATLDVEVAPTGSVVKLNNKGVRAGTRKVEPGSYTLLASKSGFSSDSTTLVVKKDETRVIGLVLIPNSAATKDWYKTHTNDELLAESITGRKFDQSSQDFAAKNPLLTKLPFIGAGFEFRIDYGKSQKGNDQPAIYIRALSTAAQNDALLWIKSQGYDPSSMEIILLHDDPANPTNQTPTT